MRECVAVITIVGPLFGTPTGLVTDDGEHPRRSRLMEAWLSHFLDKCKG